MNSNFLRLNWNDIGKGLLVAVLSACFTTLYAIVQTGGAFGAAQWKLVGMAGVTAGLGYIVKNFCSNSKGDILTPEVK